MYALLHQSPPDDFSSGAVYPWREAQWSSHPSATLTGHKLNTQETHKLVVHSKHKERSPEQTQRATGSESELGIIPVLGFNSTWSDCNSLIASSKNVSFQNGY